jgi:hypothetical protein
MIKKPLNATKGLKGTTQTYENKKRKKERNVGIDSQEKKDICLSCDKPQEKCKGACFGRD